jgi:hypothetical protein
MARARNIKPSFFQNEELGELPALARLAFIGMWTIADYKGCIEFRPKRLKIQLLPYDDCDLEQLTINLDKSGFIRIYSVSGQRFIKILNFEKHQNPHKNEKDAGSEIPDIPENYISDNGLQEIQINPEQDGTAPADSLIPLTDSLNPHSEQTRTSALDVAFEQFWNRYPKKVGKDKALIAWKKKKPRLDDVMFALSWQTNSEQWTKQSGQFIPNPTTYINEGRWKDEQPQEVTF